MGSNKKDAQLKESLTKEIDAIQVPEGLKEEIWTQINGTRKKRAFVSKVVPYIVAAAAIVIFIPLLLSLLTTSDMASNELSGRTFDIRVAGDPNFSDDLISIATFVFFDDNTFKNLKGYEEGTYELTGNKLSLLLEDENEKLELEYTLEKSERVANGYSGELTYSDFQRKDWKLISKYYNFSLKLSQYSHVLFSER